MQESNIPRFIRLLFLSIVVLITPSLVTAQETTTQAQPSPSPGIASSPVPTPEPSPKVTKVIGNLELDDVIEVRLDNLEKWAEKNDASKLVPYINGRMIRGNYVQRWSRRWIGVR